MCFVSPLSTNEASTAGKRRASVRRTVRLRLFVLLLTLLGLAAQQRVLTPTVQPSASVMRLVAEREQGIETQAVRAESALRVAPAPVFARLPWFSEPVVVRVRSRLSVSTRPAPSAHVRGWAGHFHGQLRIPRMNSEEPPRV